MVIKVTTFFCATKNKNRSCYPRLTIASVGVCMHACLHMIMFNCMHTCMHIRSAGQYFGNIEMFFGQYVISWIFLDIKILYCNSYHICHVKDEVYSLEMNIRLIL